MLKDKNVRLYETVFWW